MPTQTTWGIVTCVNIVMGIVFLGISMGMGGCSCAGECVLVAATKKCSDPFGGCLKGSYDKAACEQGINRGQNACSLDACKVGDRPHAHMHSPEH